MILPIYGQELISNGGFAMAHPPIQVHLCVKGGREAIAFYEKAFGATETFSMPANDGKRLMHATLACFGSEIMLHDDFPEHAGDVSALADGRQPGLAININLPTPTDVDAAVKKAEAAGAVVTMPVADQFWGARYGRIRDPFGHVWAFNAELPGQPKHG